MQRTIYFLEGEWPGGVDADERAAAILQAAGEQVDERYLPRPKQADDGKYVIKNVSTGYRDPVTARPQPAREPYLIQSRVDSVNPSIKPNDRHSFGWPGGATRSRQHDEEAASEAARDHRLKLSIGTLTRRRGMRPHRELPRIEEEDAQRAFLAMHMA